MNDAGGARPAHDPLPQRRSHFIYILLPGDLDPLERHERYGATLDAELQLAGVGHVSGGGSCYALDAEEEDENEPDAALFCGIDVDATDADAARAILRNHLPDLGCPVGTCVQYRERDEPLEDRYDGVGWTIGRPRCDRHPAFDL